MRRTPLRSSRGATIPSGVRQFVRDRDHGCIGPRIGMPGECSGSVQLDHVRTGGMGRKSASVPSNLASLCGNTHHVLKTEAGRVWRPVILEWLARFEEPIEPLRPDLLISSKGVSK